MHVLELCVCQMLKKSKRNLWRGGKKTPWKVRCCLSRTFALQCLWVWFLSTGQDSIPWAEPHPFYEKWMAEMAEKFHGRELEQPPQQASTAKFPPVTILGKLSLLHQQLWPESTKSNTWSPPKICQCVCSLGQTIKLHICVILSVLESLALATELHQVPDNTSNFLPIRNHSLFFNSGKWIVQQFHVRASYQQSPELIFFPKVFVVAIAQ